ncbi:hypothetical protein PsYK624_165630 [Phanerochaete sordida]|uniref:Yeast cell wall synthesis Kre9/Knh1-like N-terminal domain-containing protein n=1 Tax=Phanerochaete sordida TaxID=48140 RepID=A0A9P3GR27_9APHY|nr:hypothetical protein PsYK624_165630 [Phanerochaete sordida]
MLSSIFFATVLAAMTVRADPDPSEPGPGSVYNEGSNCLVSWDPDTSGSWKTMNIELMCGDNFNMVHLTTVATVDGTDATKASFTYPCPQVAPNAPIYFYQFTSPDSPDTLWTTRFAIADASGNVTPAPNATQPNGDSIPWGIGQLADPSDASPAPTKGSGGATVTAAPPSGSSVAVTASGGAPGSSAAGVSTPAPAASSPAAAGSAGASVPGSGSVTRTKSSMANVPTGLSSNTTGATNTTGGSAANGAVAGVSVGSRLTQAVTTLAVIGAACAVVL